MEKVKIFGEKLSNMPWQDKPEGFDGVLYGDMMVIQL
jgi:beta-1,4-mannooligosaccharide/beta-1,4-mannosyl-N-acetylglucosamine phosphorylase